MTGTIRIDGRNVVFELHGVDEILAIKRSITVPLDHVVSVSTDRAPWRMFQEIKAGGTSIPGLVKDGRYLDVDGNIYFDEMHDPDKCVTVSLDHETYRQILFEVEDKEAAAKMIRDAISGTGRT